MTTTSTHSSVSVTTQPHRRRLVAPGLAAAAAAGLATTLVAAMSKGAGVDFAGPEGEESIPLQAFTTLTFTFSIIGLAVAAGIRRWGKRPATTFLRTALAMTAISLVPPFLIGVDLASSACLVLTHLIAAAIVIPTLTRSLSTPSVSLP
jgi:hypothetical protein